MDPGPMDWGLFFAKCDAAFGLTTTPLLQNVRITPLPIDAAKCDFGRPNFALVSLEQLVWKCSLSAMITFSYGAAR